MYKHVLIHIVRDGGHLRIGVLPQLQNGYLALGGVGVQQFLTQPRPLLFSEGVFHGVQVERDGEEKPPVSALMGGDPLGVIPGQVGDYTVLVAPPLGKPRQVVEHPPVIGVENVRAVLVDQNSGVVQAVIGVAAHVGAALQHQHPLAAVLRQPPGAH